MIGTALAHRRPAPTFQNTVRTLSRFTRILREAADFFVRGNTRLAQAGRNKVERDVHGGTGKESFHADVQLLLATLLERLANHGDTLTPSLQREVSDTLGVYDALVRESYPSRGAATNHQGVGLWNLQRRYEERSEDRHMRLGYRRCLFCPLAPRRKALKHRIRQCISAFQLYKPEVAAADELGTILPELDRIEEWEAPSSLSMHIDSLQRVLESHWKCRCHSRALHESQKVRLSFSAARGEDVLGTYRLCIVPAAGAPRTATLYLMEPAQEPVRRRVQFDLASRQNAQSWKACRSFCATAHFAGIHSTFKASETSLECFMPNDQPDLQMASERSWMSLHHLLSAEPPVFNNAYTFPQRIRLGLTLAYVYLYTSHTSIWANHETEPSVWFGNHSHNSQSNKVQPYIQYGPDIGKSSTVSSFAKFMNTARPSLPALGKLLLEIWVGSKMIWDDLLDHLERCKLTPGGRYWALAVETCLCGAGDDILKNPGNLRDSDAMRAFFVLRVIKSMQWLLVYCYGEPLGDIFDATNDSINHVGMNRLVHNSEMMTNIARTPSDNGSIANNVNKNQLSLYDDTDGWKTSNETEHRAAREWQDKLRFKTEKVFESITSPPNPTVPVRVAIIDTGVSFGKRALLLYSRRIKEFRSWVGVAEQDYACGEKLPLDSGDTDGHGTHTASVLMGTDLHCDVYIAKAFTGRPGLSECCAADTHRSVANAIRYAITQWKVDVISMSFGFDDIVEEIRIALDLATEKKIVLLAAASNYGGNKDESWPARSPKVICVYATDGHGNPYHRNPTPSDHGDAFSILGTEVYGHWLQDRTALKSGTSVATPVAAGVASLVIKFMRDVGNSYLGHRDSAMPVELYDSRLSDLTTSNAMRRVFYLMSKYRDGYYYVAPWRLFIVSNDSVHSIAHQIMGAIEASL